VTAIIPVLICCHEDNTFLAKSLGRSQAAIMRDLIDEHLAPKKRLSLYERAKDLCGSVRGSKDLSTRPLTGYGRD